MTYSYSNDTERKCHLLAHTDTQLLIWKTKQECENYFGLNMMNNRSIRFESRKLGLNVTKNTGKIPLPLSLINTNTVIEWMFLNTPHRHRHYDVFPHQDSPNFTFSLPSLPTANVLFSKTYLLMQWVLAFTVQLDTWLSVEYNSV